MDQDSNVGGAATIVVGLLAGTIGAGVTGLLQIRRDRFDRLRERQLTAADDFATAASEVFIRLTARMEALPEAESEEQKREWLEQLTAALRESRKELHEATGRLPRIELLFGVESPAASAAVNLMNHLHRMSLELQKEDVEVEVFTREWKAAADASSRFNSEAHLVLAQSWWYQRQHRKKNQKS
jgi:hypothetical protein